MSLLHNAIPLKRTPSHRLSLASISALFGALLLAIFSGAASAQTDGPIGRGFTGVAMSVDAVTGLMTVESKGAVFQVTITDSTIINNLPDTGKPAKCMSRSPPRLPLPRSTQAIQP